MRSDSGPRDSVKSTFFLTEGIAIRQSLTRQRPSMIEEDGRTGYEEVLSRDGNGVWLQHDVGILGSSKRARLLHEHLDQLLHKLNRVLARAADEGDRQLDAQVELAMRRHAATVPRAEHNPSHTARVSGNGKDNPSKIRVALRPKSRWAGDL